MTDNLNIIPSNRTSKSLTPEQQRALLIKQLDKQQRLTITDFTTFGKIHTWNDFTKSSGLQPPPNLIGNEINVGNIREAFAIIRKQIENENHIHSDSSVSTDSIDPNNQINVSHEESKRVIEEARRVIQNRESSSRYIEDDEFAVIPSLRHNPHVQYNHQQERAAADILRRYISKNHYSVGFPWPVGTGKTYVFAAVICELYKRGWKPIVDSVALYPIVVVTRATIVEQTERVLRDDFGLQLGKQVDVTNIDQLRSKFGENFVRENVKVVDGIETVTYEWIAPLAPGLIVLDESQSVKNIDSSQSKIMQAFNELEGKEHRTLYCSATMFTRIVESKAFAVSTRLEW